MANSKDSGGNTTTPNPSGPPTMDYGQGQVALQVVDLRMDVKGLETQTVRVISDVRDLTTEVKVGFREANDRTHAVAVDMAKLTERVSHLPTKGFIVVSLLLWLTVVGALVIFQGNIARIVGATPLTAPVANTQPTPGLPGATSPAQP